MQRGDWTLPLSLHRCLGDCLLRVVRLLSASADGRAAEGGRGTGLPSDSVISADVRHMPLHTLLTQHSADVSAERQKSLISMQGRRLARITAKRRLRQRFDVTAGALRGQSQKARHTCRAPCEPGCAPELGSLGASSSLLGCSMTSRNAVAASPKYTVTTSRPCPSRASPSFPFRSCSCDGMKKQHQPLCHKLQSG